VRRSRRSNRCARASSNVTQPWSLVGVVKGRLPERSVKRLEIIGFFATVGQIKQDGGWDDRHASRSSLKAAPGLGQFLHNRFGSGQAEGRATGQHERVDCVDRAAWIEKFGFARAWRLSEDRDAGDGGRIEQHNTGAGFGIVIAGMADTDADDIAKAICLSLMPHGTFSLFCGRLDRS
jgi:hypothetical protein